MSGRFEAWTNLLAQRDAALASIAGLAFLAVLNWHILRWMPEGWRAKFEPVYLAAMVVILYVTLAVVVLAPR
jgi:hypothetical protein